MSREDLEQAPANDAAAVADVQAPAEPEPSDAGRRILVTGLSTYWGGRLAEALERNPRVEAIIGVDSENPTRELERTEFVRVSNQHALISRIVISSKYNSWRALLSWMISVAISALASPASRR